MEADLAFAESALARGDYSQCLIALEELTRKYPLNSEEGPEIRMLMITAWMGKGDNEKAKLICRELTRCKDNEQREIYRQLLLVLQSPSLEKPSNWSIKLPSLDIATSEAINLYQPKIKSTKKEKELPPTGPTKGLGVGFSTFALIISIVLMILLSGCVQITTDIEVPGPDRVKVNWEIQSITKKLLPWQLEFENSLADSLPQLRISTTPEGKQNINTKVLRSEEANSILQKIFSSAAQSAGFDINQPILSLKEKNWLIGVKQDLQLVVDLKDLPKMPGSKFLVQIHLADNKKPIGNPYLTTIDGDHFNWQLQQGALNTLVFHQWRWNYLTIGSIFIITLLGFNLILQKIRLRIGFGYPELPP